MRLKLAAIVFSLIFATSLYSGPNGAGAVAGNPLNSDPSGQGQYFKTLILNEISAQQQQQVFIQKQKEYELQVHTLNTLRHRLDELKNNNGDGLFRTVRGVTNCVYSYSAGWREISGRVIQTLTDGILVRTADAQDCFVKGYPSQTVDDQSLSDCMAKEDGVYTYTTLMGSSRTVRNFSYGTSVAASPEMVQKSIGTLEAEIDNHPLVLKAKADQAAKQKVIETKAKMLKLNQEQADRGDSYGLLRMGERFRDGDGVDKDLDKAKEYFEKSADAGSPIANEELKKLKSASK